MKHLITSIIFTLALIINSAWPLHTCLAQAPERFSYQGVARDVGGTPLINANISLRLSLRSASPIGNVVYQETHSTSTNALGLFTVQVGGGTGGSGFSSIDWGADSYFLQLELDPDGSTAYQDMGTTQLLSVPYALYAETSGSGGEFKSIGGLVQNSTNTISDNFVFGSSSMYDLPGQDDANRFFFHKEKGAFRAGSAGLHPVSGNDLSHCWNLDNIGDDSFATGFGTIASGLQSTAMGATTTASGQSSTALGQHTISSGYVSTAIGASTTASADYSTAMGSGSTASGYMSTATGTITTASGAYSTAMGLLTIAPSYAETSLGAYNTYYLFQSAGSWSVNDRLFTIGNGTADLSRSDALSILKNGDMKIGNKGTYFTNVQEGRISAGTQSGNNKKSVTLTFPTPFTTAANVRVQLTPNLADGLSDAFILSVRNITATNCTVEIYRADAPAGTGWGTAFNIIWSAWE